MSSKKPNARREVEHILDRLAESIEATSPEELVQEAKDAGVDTKKIAEETKETLLAALKRLEQQPLHRARQRYRSNLADIQSRNQRIANTPTSRREQFFTLLSRNPTLGKRLTIQHRELEDLNDEDITSALEELDILGALDDDSDNPDD
jgi:hypothetical protein